MRSTSAVVTGFVAFGVTLPAQAQYAGALSVDQVGQQVTRQATDTIGQRGLALATPGAEGASLWFNTTYDYLSLRPPGSVGFPVGPRVKTDLTQTMFGAEWRHGRWLVGLAGSVAVSRGRQGPWGWQDSVTYAGAPNPFTGATGRYSSTDTYRVDINPLRVETEAYSIAPYVAFAAAKHLILTGTLGYTRRDDRLRPGGSTATVTEELGPGYQALGLSARSSRSYSVPGFNSGGTDGTVFTDIAANAVAPIGDTGVTVAGRLGYRYASTWSTPFNGTGAAVQTAYLGVQAFYRTGRFTPFGRVQWEYSNPTTDVGIYYPKYPRDAVYLSAGVEYRVTDRIAAGLTLMTQVADPSITHRQVALNLRYSF